MQGKIVQLVASGALAVVFIAWGFVVLVRGRTTVVNPNNAAAYPGLLGKLLFRRDPDPTAATGLHVQASGAVARGRAALYLAIGAVCAALFAFSLLG